MKDLQIICYKCGEPFIFTVGEQQFYNSHGYCSPKRCRKCRKNNKMDESILNKLNYKRSSFIDNAKIYGMPVSVAGGLYIEYSYVFSLQKEDANEIWFIRFDDENRKLYKTDKLDKATAYLWSNGLYQRKRKLEKMFPNYNVVLYPKSDYCGIR